MGIPKEERGNVLPKEVARALKKKGAKIEYLSEEGGKVIFSTDDYKPMRTSEGTKVWRQECAESTQLPTYFQIVDEHGEKIFGGQVHPILQYEDTTIQYYPDDDSNDLTLSFSSL